MAQQELKTHVGRIEQELRRIYHPIQKDYLTFLETSEETGGERSLFEMEVAPGGGNPLHVHASYAEHFEVIQGEFGVQIGQEVRLLQAGQAALVPPHTPHRWFNASTTPVVCRIELRPGH